MSDPLLVQLRHTATTFPEVTERMSHGAPCFYVRKRPLCYFHGSEFASDGRTSLWCPSPPGVPAEMVAGEPERFFHPQPSSSGVFSTWLGVYLDTGRDGSPDWDEIEAVLRDAYRQIAPKKLIAELKK